MYVIPINPSTQPLIGSLNGGVVPEIEAMKTYYVYYINGRAPEIIDEHQLNWVLNLDWAIDVKMYRIK